MSKIDQKEYLKKYLSGDKKKKKKKKESTENKSRVSIIDDDINIIRNHFEDNDELILTGEDAPQIVGILDDRPPELKTIEDFRSSGKWKSVSKSDNGFEVNKERRKSSKKFPNSGGNICNELGPQSSLEKKNSSFSRKIGDSQKSEEVERISGHRIKLPKLPESYNFKSSEDDFSPKRKAKDDLLPPRKRTDDNYYSPRKHRDFDCSFPKTRKDEDYSPRKTEKILRDCTMKKLRWNDSDCSPSPQENIRKERAELVSKRKRRNSSLDLSPARENKKDKSSSVAAGKSKGSDNDYSPPRKYTPTTRKSENGETNKNNNYKAVLTLDGKRAGLQDAKMLKLETEKFRRKEDEMFKNMCEDISGKNADIVVREKRTKSIAEMEGDVRKEREKMMKEREKQETYSRWGIGLKQVEDYKNKMADEMHEKSKPLARYSNDADLDEMLKKQERDGDPMLTYMREKHKEKNKTGGTATIPIYKGPFPENRFNIKPGYRWDGVDRSNGYEKKWFDVQNQKKAIQEEAYKYSIEDM